jgi:hypothetical protein
MKGRLAIFAVLVALVAPASAQLTSQQQRMKDCQHAGERHDRRRPQAVYEFVSERRLSRHPRTALHQREALRQLLHRDGQGVPQVGYALS